MKILIIGPSWVGDAVIAQSLYKQIKKNYPDSSLDVLATSWTISLVKRMKEVSEVILFPFNHGEISIRKRLSFGKNLSSRNYDWSIVLPNSLKSSIIPLASKVSKRTGWLGELRFFFLNDFKKLNSVDHPLLVQRYCALANNFEPVGQDFMYPALEVDKNNLMSLCNKFHISNFDKPLILCPGAEFGPAKRWPPENYAEVGKYFLGKNNKVIVLGSVKDTEVCSEIEKNISTKRDVNFINLCGKTSLEDAIDILSMGIVLSNDSGLMHIAAAVGSPQIALYGPTDPNFTPPLNKKAKVIRKVSGYRKIRATKSKDGFDSSLKDISTEEVIECVEALLMN